MRNSFEFEELDEAVNLEIHTRVPTKWLLLDSETAQVYVGNKSGFWVRLDPVTKLED